MAENIQRLLIELGLIDKVTGPLGKSMEGIRRIFSEGTLGTAMKGHHQQLEKLKREYEETRPLMRELGFTMRRGELPQKMTAVRMKEIDGVMEDLTKQVKKQVGPWENVRFELLSAGLLFMQLGRQMGILNQRAKKMTTDVGFMVLQYSLLGGQLPSLLFLTRAQIQLGAAIRGLPKPMQEIIGAFTVWGEQILNIFSQGALIMFALPQIVSWLTTIGVSKSFTKLGGNLGEFLKSDNFKKMMGFVEKGFGIAFLFQAVTAAQRDEWVEATSKTLLAAGLFIGTQKKEGKMIFLIGGALNLIDVLMSEDVNNSEKIINTIKTVAGIGLTVQPHPAGKVAGLALLLLPEIKIENEAKFISDITNFGVDLISAFVKVFSVIPEILVELFNEAYDAILTGRKLDVNAAIGRAVSRPAAGGLFDVLRATPADVIATQGFVPLSPKFRAQIEQNVGDISGRIRMEQGLPFITAEDAEVYRSFMRAKGITPVGDFIISNGRILKPASNDTIMGFNNNAPGFTGNEINITVNGAGGDPEAVAREIRSELERMQNEQMVAIGG